MKTILTSEGKQGIVQEGESCNIVATFSFAGATIAKSAIITLRLTLYDLATNEVINSREDQNIRDANDGLLSTNGTLTLRLGPDDNTVVGDLLDAGDFETHVVRLEWTWDDGVKTRTGVSNLSYVVEKIATPAAPV